MSSSNSMYISGRLCRAAQSCLLDITHKQVGVMPDHAASRWFLVQAQCARTGITDGVVKVSLVEIIIEVDNCSRGKAAGVSHPPTAHPAMVICRQQLLCAD
jgi:hypothetical protein